MLALLRSRRLVSFFASSGILPATGLFSGLARIVVQRLLPELPDAADFHAAIRQVFHRRGDWAWLQEISPALSLRFWRVISGGAGAIAPQRA